MYGMYHYRLSVLLYIIYWSFNDLLASPGILMDSDRLYRPVPVKIDELCRGNSVCMSRNETPQASASGKPCCRNCSCSEDCEASSERCCYGPMKGTLLQEYMTCQELVFERRSTLEPELTSNRSKQSVFVVDKIPVGGCVNSSLQDCCDSTIYPWGTSMYLVQAVTTGKIYKNEDYARCHGEYDFKKTETTVMCDKISALSLTEGCTLTFKPEINDDNVCFKDDWQRCPADFIIPPHLNLTKDEVRKFCERDFYSFYGRYYKNVYCYICQSGMPIISDWHCPVTQSPFTETLFFSLIDIAILIDQSSRFKTPPPTICGATSHGKTEQICRPLDCPEGQIWAGWECVYGMSTWELASITVMLKLHLPLGVTLHMGSFPDLESRLTSPWPVSWQRRHYIYYYPYGIHKADLTETFSLHMNQTHQTDAKVSSFYVTVSIPSRMSVNPRNLLMEITDSLAKKWTMDYEGEKLQLEQTMSQHSLDTILVLTPTDGLPFYVEKWAISELQTNQPDGEYQVFQKCHPYSSIPPGDTTIIVTKLFLCDQISLTKKEVFVYTSELDGGDVALVIWKTGVTLYDQEFTTSFSHQGEVHYRVCADDYGFASTSRGNELTLQVHVPMLWCLLTMNLF